MSGGSTTEKSQLGPVHLALPVPAQPARFAKTSVINTFRIRPLHSNLIPPP